MSALEEPCPVCGVVEWSLGRKYERERIIKLLEAEFDRVFALKDYPASNAIMNVKAALIKGETE